MEAGEVDGRALDLIDVMIDSADTSVPDYAVGLLEAKGCPTCGSCSGMFTANSMNSLTEALGLSLPGNGTVVATHKERAGLFVRAARQIVANAEAYYFNGDESVLPRNIATRQAMLNAMTLDIAMGGSTIRCFICWPLPTRPVLIYNGGYRHAFAPYACFVQGCAKFKLPYAGC